jgi:hypothetical protein
LTFSSQSFSSRSQIGEPFVLRAVIALRRSLVSRMRGCAPGFSGGFESSSPFTEELGIALLVRDGESEREPGPGHTFLHDVHALAAVASARRSVRLRP